MQEYWYDVKRKGWTGPHTFPQNLILPYNSTFIEFSNSFAPGIWQSDVVQSASSTFEEPGVIYYTAEDGVTLYTDESGTNDYTAETTGTVVNYVAEDGVTPYVTENGSQDYIAEGVAGNTIEFLYQTVPMTDFQNVYANTVFNSTVEFALPSNGITYLMVASDETFAPITQATLTAPAAVAIWGQFIWGLALWGATASGLRPLTIPWPIPIVFNRLSLSVSGDSSAGLKLGSFHMTAKKLKYLLH
jgi:hypothetical protein